MDMIANPYPEGLPAIRWMFDSLEICVWVPMIDRDPMVTAQGGRGGFTIPVSKIDQNRVPASLDIMLKRLPGPPLEPVHDCYISGPGRMIGMIALMFDSMPFETAPHRIADILCPLPVRLDKYINQHLWNPMTRMAPRIAPQRR